MRPMKSAARPDVEYVLTLDHTAKADLGTSLSDSGDRVLVPAGTVVTVADVRHGGWFHESMTGGSTALEFTVKATGEKFRTNYGYMFAVNTPENLRRLANYQAARAAWFEARRVMDAAHEEVDMVEGPFERSRG